MTVQSFDPQTLAADLRLTLTAAACDHFAQQLKKANKQQVRLYLEESGCSGYMYRVELVDEALPTDRQVTAADDFKVLVADDACAILHGTEIDYKKEGLNALLKFNNPNVTAECGCGESFVVDKP